MMTDADLLARLIKADPRLGSVIAEARDIGMHDAHIVDILAQILADECQCRYGYPPQSFIVHLARHGNKPR